VEATKEYAMLYPNKIQRAKTEAIDKFIDLSREEHKQEQRVPFESTICSQRL